MRYVLLTVIFSLLTIFLLSFTRTLPWSATEYLEIGDIEEAKWVLNTVSFQKIGSENVMTFEKSSRSENIFYFNGVETEFLLDSVSETVLVKMKEWAFSVSADEGSHKGFVTDLALANDDKEKLKEFLSVPDLERLILVFVGKNNEKRVYSMSLLGDFKSDSKRLFDDTVAIKEKLVEKASTAAHHAGEAFEKVRDATSERLDKTGDAFVKAKDDTVEFMSNAGHFVVEKKDQLLDKVHGWTAPESEAEKAARTLKEGTENAQQAVKDTLDKAKTATGNGADTVAIKTQFLERVSTAAHQAGEAFERVRDATSERLDKTGEAFVKAKDDTVEFMGNAGHFVVEKKDQFLDKVHGWTAPESETEKAAQTLKEGAEKELQEAKDMLDKVKTTNDNRVDAAQDKNH